MPGKCETCGNANICIKKDNENFRKKCPYQPKPLDKRLPCASMPKRYGKNKDGRIVNQPKPVAEEKLIGETVLTDEDEIDGRDAEGLLRAQDAHTRSKVARALKAILEPNTMFFIREPQLKETLNRLIAELEGK